MEMNHTAHKAGREFCLLPLRSLSADAEQLVALALRESDRVGERLRAESPRYTVRSSVIVRPVAI